MKNIKSFVVCMGRQKIYLLAFILLFVGILSIYGVKGSYSRYAQDDYCYGYRVRAEGFWNMQIQSYYHQTEFNSDRFSLTFAHSLAELLGGPGFVPILPSLEMVAWLGSMVYVFFQLLGSRFSKKGLLVATTAGLIIIFFTLYLAPNLYQILFWLSGMQTYLTPVVLGTFLFGRFIAMTRSPKFKVRHVIELGILSILAGGFSETTALWQFACWSIILGWSLIFRRKSVPAKNARWPSLIMVLSTALSLVILAICPMNFKFASYTHPDLPALITQSFSYGAGFIWLSIKGTPLPYLIILAFGFFLSGIINIDIHRKPRDLVLKLLIALFMLFLLSVVVMVPTLYATAHYPGDRALLPANFTLVLCLFFIGWESANLFSAFKPDIFSVRFSKIYLVLLGLVLFVYVARTTPRVYDKLPVYRDRAEAWDIRQSMILKDKSAGIKDITIPAFDSIYGITELHYEADNWVNECAAAYYAVRSITTVDNYAGISAHPIGK